ncbi:hypothetical protein MTO96_029578 [Rhipicephalus appendiculatus]
MGVVSRQISDRRKLSRTQCALTRWRRLRMRGLWSVHCGDDYTRLVLADLCAAMLDFTNAYGSVPHMALLDALRGARAGEVFTALMADLYASNRTQMIGTGGTWRTYHHWKTVDPEGRFLATLFNAYVHHRRTPRRLADVQNGLRPKKGDVQVPSNWRPITLGSTASMLYAKSLVTWLQDSILLFSILSLPKTIPPV